MAQPKVKDQCSLKPDIIELARTTNLDTSVNHAHRSFMSIG